LAAKKLAILAGPLKPLSPPPFSPATFGFARSHQFALLAFFVSGWHEHHNMLRDVDRERGGAILAAHKTGAVAPPPEFVRAHRDQRQNLDPSDGGALGARRRKAVFVA
jgi:hypothetical protein